MMLDALRGPTEDLPDKAPLILCALGDPTADLAAKNPLMNLDAGGEVDGNLDSGVAPESIHGGELVLKTETPPSSLYCSTLLRTVQSWPSAPIGPVHLLFTR